MFDGWYQYFERDIRTLLGLPTQSPFANGYCGARPSEGLPAVDLGARSSPPASPLPRAQGPDPASWRVSAIPERITFTPGLLPFTMRYTNRPSGIQQVISFSGHG